MNAEAVVYALLSGAGPVTAIVGTRIYPVALPERQPTPAVVYQVISSVPVGRIDAQAASHLTRTRVQVDVLSKDHTVLKTLRDACVAALRFQRGTVGGVVVHTVLPEPDGPTTYDRELAVYHRPVDFMVIHESP